MSDALLKLMEPYVWWPPAPDELVELQAWLRLGASVWNATVESSTSLQLGEKLRGLAATSHVPGQDEPIEMLEELAIRKLKLFPRDHRRVGVVKVWADGGRAQVEATSLAYLR